MAKNVLDKEGLVYLWNKIKNKIPTKTSELENDNNFLTSLNFYPVGSIYISANDTNPSNLFGGTWEQIKDRFLLGASEKYTNGSIGGEEEHTLTEKELPAHFHSGIQVNNPKRTNFDYIGSERADAGAWNKTTNNNTVGAYQYANYNGFTGPFTADNSKTGSVGSGEAHNNMPPFLAVFIWKRIS